jgi:O-antigen/teichoic acid export membrane protein
LLLRVTAAAIAIGAGGVAAAYLFGPALLALFYGVGYAKYSTAFLICTIGSTFWLVTSALGFAATAQGRFGVQPAAMILTLVVLAAGLFALVPRFGVNGASIATAVSAMAGMAAYLAIVVRNENDKPRIPR